MCRTVMPKAARRVAIQPSRGRGVPDTSAYRARVCESWRLAKRWNVASVTFVDVPPEAAHQAALGSGIPPACVEALPDLLAAMKAGYTGAVTDTVHELLGRPAATFQSWATRNAGAFQR
jgi:hypothetical protein